MPLIRGGKMGELLHVSGPVSIASSGFHQFLTHLCLSLTSQKQPRLTLRSHIHPPLFLLSCPAWPARFSNRQPDPALTPPGKPLPLPTSHFPPPLTCPLPHPRIH